jgi:hypothetical protein
VQEKIRLNLLPSADYRGEFEGVNSYSVQIELGRKLDLLEINLQSDSTSSCS